jgi:hypothetical protein
LVNSRFVVVRKGKMMNWYKHRFVVKALKHPARASLRLLAPALRCIR